MADIRNPIIGWPRSTGYWSVSGGAWNAQYPAANLVTDRVSAPARSLGNALAQTQWLLTSTALRAVGHLGLVAHNAGSADQYRYRLYADTAATQLVKDTGWLDFWPRVFPFGSLPFGDPRWYDGRYGDDDKKGYVWTKQTVLDRLYFARSILVEVNATTNPAGYFECGLCEVAQGWQLNDGIENTAEIDAAARSVMTEAPGGARYWDVRVPRRTFRGKAPLIPTDEWLAQGFELRRRAGVHTPFLWLPYPQQPALEPQTGFLATWATDAGAVMTYAANPYGMMPLCFDEVLGS